MGTTFPKVLRSTAAPTVQGTDLAVGLWSPTPREDFRANQVARIALAGLRDKVFSYGLRAHLWVEQQPLAIADPLDLRPGSGVCSCVTEAQRAPEKECRTCHGTSHIGGFEQWGYRYYHAASVGPTVSLINCHLDTEVKPNRILLDVGQLKGSVETTAFEVVNPQGYPFESRVDAYLRGGPTGSVDVEWSTGGAWQPLHVLGSTTAPPRDGTLRFRIYLRRAVVTDKSPVFEILRVRHRRVAVAEIKLLRNAPRQSRSRQNYGVVEEMAGQQWWTVPLRFFDPDNRLGIAEGTVADRLPENGAFVQLLEGAVTDRRLKLNNVQYTDPLGVFSTQRATVVRQVQPDEIEHRVF